MQPPLESKMAKHKLPVWLVEAIELPSAVDTEIRDVLLGTPQWVNITTASLMLLLSLCFTQVVVNMATIASTIFLVYSLNQKS
jgi:hypothetical protein